VAGPRGAWLIAALLVTVGSGCGVANPAGDFCSSYGAAVHDVVVAARGFDADPAGFASTYESTLEGLGKIRAKAPNDELRSAFDRSMFTFSVWDSQEDLADFLGRADFSTNAVVIACAEYGVEVRI
jgi:hypothetical protein